MTIKLLTMALSVHAATPATPIWTAIAERNFRCDPMSSHYALKLNCRVSVAARQLKAKGDSTAHSIAVSGLNDLIEKSISHAGCTDQIGSGCDLAYRKLDWAGYRADIRVIGQLGKSGDNALIEKTFNAVWNSGNTMFQIGVGSIRDLVVAWLRLSQPSLSVQDSLGWASQAIHSSGDGVFMGIIVGDVIGTYWKIDSKPWTQAIIDGLSNEDPDVRAEFVFTTPVDRADVPKSLILAYLPLLDDKVKHVRKLARIDLQVRVCISKWKSQLEQYAGSSHASSESRALIEQMIHEKGNAACNSPVGGK